jgi:ADP-heptose:LPS heptosyltransferase
MTARVPHFLVIRRRYLGDIVLLGSLLHNLRLHWPAAQFTVLTEPAYAGLLALNPDNVQPLLLPPGLGAWPGFLRTLRRAHFTHVLDLDNTEKTAAIALLSGASLRVGLHHGIHRLKLRAAYTHVVHDPTELHETRPITEYYLRALEPLGVPVLTREIRLVPRSDDLAAMARLVGAAGKILLVHPGTRSAYRLWPVEQFAAVCDFAQDALGAQVVLTGGPGDATALAAIRRHARTHLLPLPDTLPIGRFAALAKLASAVLCHDSGPMHVAAATGARVIALYGSQNAVLFRPPGENHLLLQPPLPCAACVAPGQCMPGDSYKNFCVRLVDPSRVRSALRAALA